MMNDQDIIIDLQRGDIQKLEHLVKRYQLTAIRAAFLILQDEESAKDVAADGFLRAYNNIQKFDNERSFGPWLFTIVTNLARRKAKRERNLLNFSKISMANQINHDDSPEKIIENKEIYEYVYAAISKLNIRQRTILTQRYYLEMSIKEIAKAQNMPEGTVKWHLSQARQKLKNQLSPYFSKESKYA